MKKPNQALKANRKSFTTNGQRTNIRTPNLIIQDHNSDQNKTVTEDEQLAKTVLNNENLV